MSRLEIRLLGAFQASLDGLPLTNFESNKVRGLLAFLAIEADCPHSREKLAALLWPEMSDQAARSNLRYALSDLRSIIGDQKGAICLSPDYGTGHSIRSQKRPLGRCTGFSNEYRRACR